MSEVPVPVPPERDSSEAPPAVAPSKKAPPSNLVVPPKKPKLSKAERRALQEEQRAAKGGGGGASARASLTPPLQNGKVHVAVNQLQQQPPHQQTLPSGNKATGTSTEIVADVTLQNKPLDPKKSKGISLLSHLPPYRGTFELSENPELYRIL